MLRTCWLLIYSGGRPNEEANSYVKLVGNEFKVPCNCEPHVLVMGSSFQGVDKGAKIVKEVVRDHMRVCSCRIRMD